MRRTDDKSWPCIRSVPCRARELAVGLEPPRVASQFILVFIAVASHRTICDTRIWPNEHVTAPPFRATLFELRVIFATTIELIRQVG